MFSWISSKVLQMGDGKVARMVALQKWNTAIKIQMKKAIMISNGFPKKKDYNISLQNILFFTNPNLSISSNWLTDEMKVCPEVKSPQQNMQPFPTPWKYQKTLRFSDVFSG